ncbi:MULTISPECIES: demethylmenaquinone methyltransferase [Lactococcus]|uniref:Demethylmenaquinone methyltransferase n=1 Tax=Lactococcus garvieae TaxID=1363 RepID=A0A1I4IID5_9LACT|nr:MULTISPECIES: demethylmenaquinone methyltransferase [Lactococcus]RGB58877.1 demethylmenaquinone methyltransferase [Lactococcus petauri]SFL53546.1 2-octaprenyl-6-methoxy-1,4-benzoquinone methylase /demethylmenaquinone methyltransferase [Lactococcus garvieae]
MNKVNEERVHEIFNNISTDYDKMNAIISFKQHDLWRDKTMKKMGNLSGMTILDLCCGTGDWTFDLSKAVGQMGKVVGLDFSENMLKVAQAKIDKNDNNNIEFIQGNAMAIPFEKEMFDVVTIGYGLRNTPDYLTVLREIFRVLKPGGKVVCIETSHPTLPIYKQAFELYFKKVMPFLGKVFAKSLREYQWLQKSAENFPDAKALALLFSKAGFSTVSYQKYGGGAIATHFGTKDFPVSKEVSK